MSFSNASTSVDLEDDDEVIIVDQRENDMPPSATPSSGVRTLKRRPHANADDEQQQQQKEIHEKIARMEMELRDTKQLGRIKELELEKEFREKFVRMGMELRSRELENRLLQAELREQKLLAERNALQSDVDRMKQDQQQQEKDSAVADQFTKLQSDQEAMLEQIGQLEGAQQQQMNSLKEQIEKSEAAQTEMCAKIAQLERKQTLSLPLQNSWDANACHDDLVMDASKCSVVSKRWVAYRSVLAKHSILNSASGIFYFELRIDNMKCWMVIGLATKAMPLDGCVGGHPNSYGYSNTGNFWINAHLNCKNTPYSAGDVVGCGVILATRQLIFTKNGQRLGTTDLFISASPLSALFPCITLCNTGAGIEANFGPVFQFDVDTLR